MMVAVDKKAEKLVKQNAEKYSLKLLLLFGSRATGKNYATSDFDVAYLSNKDLDLMEEARLMLDLSPVFKSEDIDLVNLKKAPPLLYYAVFQDCQVLYEKDPLIFPNLRAYAFKRYVEEAKPLAEARWERLQKQMKEWS